MSEPSQPHACPSHDSVRATALLQASARAAGRCAGLHVWWLRQPLLQSQLQIRSVLRRSWSWRVPKRRRRQRRGAWQLSWRACAVRGQQNHPGYVTHTFRLVSGQDVAASLRICQSKLLSCTSAAGPAQNRGSGDMRVPHNHTPSTILAPIFACLTEVLRCPA